MSLLAAAHYDPATAASVATSSLLAMTAIDTTNLRVTFTTPSSNGTAVLVRMRGSFTGGTDVPEILLGVLDGSTVKARIAPRVGRGGSSAASQIPFEASVIITGLSNNTSYTWDAAYGVEFAVASSLIKYGGPDDTTVNNAWGGFGFEVWSAETLLGGKHYDPSTVANQSLAAAQVMTALDTTNLRLTFTTGASGNVLIRLRGVAHGTTATAGGTLLFGVLDGSSIIARARPQTNWTITGSTPIATAHLVQETKVVIAGLTPSHSYTWDAALGIETAATSGNLSWGGPNNTSQDDAYGGFTYEVWDTGGTAGGSTFSYMIGMVI